MSERKIKVCANCKEPFSKGDRYCRYCGAQLGTPDYIEENFACIYGPPPIKRIHKCENCGYSWKTVLMLDKESFCPKCGGPAPVSEEIDE